MMSSLYDSFVDYCTANDLDPTMEDFDAWKDERAVIAREEQQDRDLKYALENG